MTEESKDRIAEATRRQLRAADPNQSVWVSANAGSGKTRVLTNRVIRLMLTGTPPERILCLTYTKAAAAEMAGRLFSELSHWASFEDDKLIDEVRKLTGASVSENDLRAARRLFALALETPGGLKIQTIHAFCESLLGRFPLEAGIPARFEVMDDRRSSELLQEARNMLFGEIAQDSSGELAQAFTTLVAETSDDRIEGLLDEIAARRKDMAVWINRAGGQDPAKNEIYKVLGLPVGMTTERFSREHFENMNHDRRENLIRAADVLEVDGGKDDRKAAENIRRVLAGDVDDPLKVWLSIFLTAKNEPRKRGFVVKKIRDGAQDIADIMDVEQSRAVQVSDTIRKIRLASNTVALLVLGFDLAERFEQTKIKLGLLDFSDLINRTRKLLERPDVAPWVMYKLDGGIDHILVDEAQDTSPDQWAVIRSLADEFFQGESARELNRTIFAVGDEKQSIYSFQGAAPEEFSTTRSHFHQEAQNGLKAFEDISLNLSFRSTEQILDFVDRCFTETQAQTGLSADGRRVNHEAARTGVAGHVELWPLEEPVIEEPNEPWDIPLDRPGGQSPMVRLARRIAQTISDWLDNRQTLPNGKLITPGDILVLVRQRTQLMDALIRAFKERNIPVAGADRMRLTDQLAVMDLMALARFTLLPQDDLTLAVVLKSPLIGMSEDQLFEIAHGRAAGVSLWQALRNKAEEEIFKGQFADAFSFLQKVLARADVLPTFEFFSSLLDEDDGRKKIVGRLGLQANDPLDEFLSLTLDFEQVEVPNLQGFLRWLDRHEAIIKRDMEQQRDEVRVMTVHGAKGLEAPIVFMPDMCSPPVGRAASLFDVDGAIVWSSRKADDDEKLTMARTKWEEKQKAEYHRLLYVGLTRAEDRLYLAGYTGKQKGRMKDSWYDVIAPVMLEYGLKRKSLDGRTIWYMGSDTATDSAVGATEQVDVPRSSHLPPWAIITPRAEQAPVRPLAPSQPLNTVEISRSPLAAGEVLSGNVTRFQRGNLIHGLLERLPAIDQRQRSLAGLRYLKRQLPEASEDFCRDLVEDVLKILDEPSFADLFGPKSFAEVPIAGHVPDLGADVVIAGRIDRLVIKENSILVVDYKSNRPPPSTVEEVSDAYIWQMATYRAALKRLYPSHTLNCALLWTDLPRLMTLPDKIMDDLIERRKS